MIGFRLAFAFCATLGLMPIVCEPVFARAVLHAPSQDDADEAPEGYLPRLSAEAGRLCVKQCPSDDNPCDPPDYKRADGRCTTQWQ